MHTDCTRLIRSIPALAAHLRSVHTRRVQVSSAKMCPCAALVPSYHPAGLGHRKTGEKTPSQLRAEAEAMVPVYRRLVDHCHRLSTAFREWQEFDPSPFFDLYPDQAEMLVRQEKGKYYTRVSFCGDMLIPAFQAAETYFVETFAPTYQSAHGDRRAEAAVQAAYVDAVEPEMVRRWQHLTTVAQRLNWPLQDDLDFLVIVDGAEELFGWRDVWQEPAAAGLHSSLLPAWETLTTFTFAVQCKSAPLSDPS